MPSSIAHPSLVKVYRFGASGCSGLDSKPRAPGVASRCSDILQTASMEPLTATEREPLKRECR